MANRPNIPSTSSSDDEIHRVCWYIHKCLLRYMTKAETMHFLSWQANVEPLATKKVWEMFERKNIKYFEEYYKKLPLMNEMVKMLQQNGNDLLCQLEKYPSDRSVFLHDASHQQPPLYPHDGNGPHQKPLICPHGKNVSRQQQPQNEHLSQHSGEPNWLIHHLIGCPVSKQQVADPMHQQGGTASHQQPPMHQQCGTASHQQPPMHPHSGNTSLQKDVKLVNKLIEIHCISSNMTKSQAMEFLARQKNIVPTFTLAVWEKMEEEHPDFFEQYNRRLVEIHQMQGTNRLIEHHQPRNGNGSNQNEESGNASNQQPPQGQKLDDLCSTTDSSH